jgi:hypothetical protein
MACFQGGRAWRGFFIRFFFVWLRGTLAVIGWQLLAVTLKTGDGTCCALRLPIFLWSSPLPRLLFFFCHTLTPAHSPSFLLFVIVDSHRTAPSKRKE